MEVKGLVEPLLAPGLVLDQAAEGPVIFAEVHLLLGGDHGGFQAAVSMGNGDPTRI
jgi:hypothetical protein